MGLNIIEVNAEPGFLRVVIDGEFSLEEAERNFREVIDAVGLHKAEKVLFDGRAVTGEPTLMQRFYYGEFAALTVADYARKGRSRPPQFAYVLKEPVLDPGRFGETVAVNRGMNMRVFDDLEEARRWLLD